eukprot:gene962-1225_t
MVQNVWLDCDPGHDDAFAIMLAAHNPNINLLGISTVAGNQTVEKTTNNALRVLEIIDRVGTVVVVKGASVPLVRPPMVCEEIHGASGLDTATPLPQPTVSPITDTPAIVVMAQHIKKSFQETNEKVTIVACGCLTNVALLFSVYPEIKSQCKVSLLGGAMTVGNMSPVAEFNILVDPEAAKIVYESGVEVTMVPLEVSHKALVTPQIIQRIKNIGITPYTDTVCDLLHFFTKSYKALFDMDDPPLHDPLAVAYVIDPTIFKTKLLRVEIETTSTLCYGQTVCDVWGFSKLTKNVNVCLDADIPKFWDLLIDAIEKCNKVSSLNKGTNAVDDASRN